MFRSSAVGTQRSEVEFVCRRDQRLQRALCQTEDALVPELHFGYTIKIDLNPLQPLTTPYAIVKPSDEDPTKSVGRDTGAYLVARSTGPLRPRRGPLTRASQTRPAAAGSRSHVRAGWPGLWRCRLGSTRHRPGAA